MSKPGTIEELAVHLRTTIEKFEPEIRRYARQFVTLKVPVQDETDPIEWFIYFPWELKGMLL